MLRIALGVAAISIASSWANAATITVRYTGTYSASLVANELFKEWAPIPYPPGGSTAFNLNFTFDTSLAEPGYYSQTPTSSYLGGPYSYPIPPGSSVGSAVFTSSVYNFSASFFAEIYASQGETRQHAIDVSGYRYGYLQSPSIFMAAQSPDIPVSITQPYKISSGLIGGGSVYYTLDNAFYGGFVLELALSPLSLEVLVDPAPSEVPLPASLPLFVAAVGGGVLIGWRRRRNTTRGKQ